MIDNFKLIEPLFYFNESSNMFFYCQVVRRAKDHKPNKVSESAIKTYFIRSKESLDKLKDEIVFLCEHYKARAYINVSGKSFESVNKLMLYKLAEYNCITSLSNINPKKLLNNLVRDINSKNPRWVVDIDNISLKDDIKDFLIKLWAESYHRTEEIIKAFLFDFIYAEIPTVNGLHFITKPFNTKEFRAKFPNVDVHKNSMGTLLYYPKSLES